MNNLIIRDRRIIGQHKGMRYVNSLPVDDRTPLDGVFIATSIENLNVGDVVLSGRRCNKTNLPTAFKIISIDTDADIPYSQRRVRGANHNTLLTDYWKLA